MLRWIAAALLACTAISGAAYTAAWKLPGRNFVPDSLRSVEGLIRKLDSPPGESKFFQPGDELWDITRSLKVRIGEKRIDPFSAADTREERPWPGEWAVWNARSGMVVACGAWNDIFLAETALDFRELPHQVRITLELESGAGDENGGSATRSLSLAVRSGMRAEIRIDGFHAELEPVAYWWEPHGKLRLSCAWPAGPQGSEWKVTTASAFYDGERQRIARQGTGDAAWTLFATAASELIDGTTLRDARFLEGPEDFIPWLDTRVGAFTVKRLSDSLAAGLVLLPDSRLSSFGGREDDLYPSEVEAPDILAQWVRGRLVDFREPLRKMGMSLDHPDAFAGYHPLSQYLYIIASPDRMDLFEALTTPLGPCLPAKIWTETNPEAGVWGVVSVSGEKALVERTGNTHEALRFQIEPTIGSDGQLIELYHDFDIVSSGLSRGRLTSAATLQMGIPHLLATHRGTDGEELPIRITARDPGD